MAVSKEDIKKITDILNEEIQIGKRLKDIASIKAFYQDELHELAATMHQTADGRIMFVIQMTDDHLINTVRTYLTMNGDLRRVPKKYLNEVKNRDLIARVLETQSLLQASNALDEDIIDGFAEDPDV